MFFSDLDQVSLLSLGFTALRKIKGENQWEVKRAAAASGNWSGFGLRDPSGIRFFLQLMFLVLQQQVSARRRFMVLRRCLCADLQSCVTVWWAERWWRDGRGDGGWDGVERSPSAFIYLQKDTWMKLYCRRCQLRWMSPCFTTWRKDE